ncbi:hypothetical protein DHEL01_v203747 [Diaporthe helianthi]|uniref:Uncharacterized protein n=1 Tax=Diaporthe helianthi TaxID=158607 RepID=A0A2P5I5R9_DIAHE|nr:hypothetical protein DHEL01_v203747 [Diaporthe helianthi]
MAEGIARFVQTSQMVAYTEQVSSFKETVRALQANDQKVESLKAIVESLQASAEKSDADIAALQDQRHQEITCLQNTVKSLRDTNEKTEAKVAKLEDQRHQDIGSFKATVESLQASSKADSKQLQEEIAELRAQLRRTERSPVYSGQLKEPSGRHSFHSHVAKNEKEHHVFPRHEMKTNIQLHPFHDDSDNHTWGPNKPLEQQYPRGIKRAHVDDAADTSHGHLLAEETGNSHGFVQPQSQKTRHAKRADHKGVHDESPKREETKNSDMEDDSRARHWKFVAYYNSKRKEYKQTAVGRDKGALVRHFIEGIEDPDYCHWFQDALKKQFPERVHHAAHPTGKRYISVPRDLTWEDAKTVVRDVPIP